jgi:hypothetical protein
LPRAGVVVGGHFVGGGSVRRLIEGWLSRGVSI